MKWHHLLSTFVQNKMCDIIVIGVGTNNDFKEVHLDSVAKMFIELRDTNVNLTQVYNHLRK